MFFIKVAIFTILYKMCKMFSKSRLKISSLVTGLQSYPFACSGRPREVQEGQTPDIYRQLAHGKWQVLSTRNITKSCVLMHMHFYDKNIPAFFVTLPPRTQDIRQALHKNQTFFIEVHKIYISNLCFIVKLIISNFILYHTFLGCSH
jgi:hypothetical protein